MTRSDVTLCSWNSPAPSAGNTGFYLSRSVSAKQSGCPGNPVDYIIWRLMQECVYIVQDTCLRHQRLDAAHQWHMDKHITKRRSCWSMEKALVCMRESKRTSLWTSAKLKPALFRATTSHNRLPRKTRYFASFPSQIRWVKVKGQGKLDLHIIFESALMLFTKNIKISPCLSKLQLVKVGTFFWDTV